LNISVSEAARLLGVDRKLVQKWANCFAEHLSPGARPQKGTPRHFTPKDIQVFAYASMYWEDEPDLQSIKVGLNRGDHCDEPYDDVLTQVTPLFQEPPDDLDNTWRHGDLLSVGVVDEFELADSYKLAGDTLVDAALSTREAYELLYPILYNYRHATELYLKSACGPTDKGHNLRPLLPQLREHVQREHATSIPNWFESAVIAFCEADPKSTAFRYGTSARAPESVGLGGELWIDLVHAKRLMGWVAEAFQRIRSVHYQSPLHEPGHPQE
jgi:hypothetical protein